MSLELMLRAMEGFGTALEGLGATQAINDATSTVHQIRSAEGVEDEEKLKMIANTQSDLAARLAALNQPGAKIQAATSFGPSQGALYQIEQQKAMQAQAQKNELEVLEKKVKLGLVQPKLSSEEQFKYDVEKAVAIDEAKGAVKLTNKRKEQKAILSPGHSLRPGKMFGDTELKEYSKAAELGRGFSVLEKEMNDAMGSLLSKGTVQQVRAMTFGSKESKAIKSSISKLITLDKEIQKLGALTGPDMQLEQVKFPDMSSLVTVARSGGMEAVQEEVQRTFDTTYHNLHKVFSYKSTYPGAKQFETVFKLLPAARKAGDGSVILNAKTADGKPVTAGRVLAAWDDLTANMLSHSKK